MGDAGGAGRARADSRRRADDDHAVLHEQEGRTDAVVARLAALAVADELLVIFGSRSAGKSG